jgi:hypothetical protein
MMSWRQDWRRRRERRRRKTHHNGPLPNPPLYGREYDVLVGD